MVAEKPGGAPGFVRWSKSLPAGLWVGATGFVLLIVASVGYFRELDQVPTSAFLVVGAALVLASSLLDRLEGQQEFSAGGLKVNVIREREREIADGRVVPVEPAVDRGTPQAGLPTVLLTGSAQAEIQQIGATAQTEATGVVHFLSERSIHDLPSIEQLRGAGRDYHIYRGADGLRLIIRQLDRTGPDEPERYVIVQAIPA